MIRRIETSFGVRLYAVCNECRTDAPMRDDAGTLPLGWFRTKAYDMRNRAIELHYCPRCSVAPEYRN